MDSLDRHINRQNFIEHLAGTKFQLYIQYGIGEFSNWLDMKQNRIERHEVLEALTHKSVRELAEARLLHLQKQVAELEGLLNEASLPSLPGPPNS